MSEEICSVAFETSSPMEPLVLVSTSESGMELTWGFFAPVNIPSSLLTWVFLPEYFLVTANGAMNCPET